MRLALLSRKDCSAPTITCPKSQPHLVAGGCQCHEFTTKQASIWWYRSEYVCVHYVIESFRLSCHIPANPSISRTDSINRIAEAEKSDEFLIRIIKNQKAQPPPIAI